MYVKGRQKSLYGNMESTENGESIDIHVTELFGIQVWRKYVKTVGKNELNVYDKEAGRRLRVLLGSLQVSMVLSTITCAVVMVGILYHPPHLVKELSETVLIHFGKSTSAFEEQLRSANDKIMVLEEENRRLKAEGWANFTREEQLHANLSTAENANVDLLTKLSSANESIGSLRKDNIAKQGKIDELEQNHNICMVEKSRFQNSLSDCEERERGVKQDLGKCEESNEQLNNDIKQFQNKTSMLEKMLKVAEDLSHEYDENLEKCQEDKASVTDQKESAKKKLTETSNALTNCQLKNEQHQKTKANLSANLTTCQDDLKDSNRKFIVSQQNNKGLEQEKDMVSKELSATKYTLGNCKNKNMDHEVRNLELLQEIEGLKKELKAC